MNNCQLYMHQLFRTENKTEQMWKYSKKGVRDMKKKSLRILSLIVAIVMVVAMLPLSALADETKPTRKVGVVVYGSELTAILTNIEKSIKDGTAILQEGDAEGAVSTMKDSLTTLTELATSLTTGAIDGTGFSVPNLDIEIKDENGKNYSVTEQPVEIFSQTTEMTLPLSQELEEVLDQVETESTELKQILKDWEPIEPAIDIIGVNDKIHNLVDNIDKVDFDSLSKQLTQLVNDLVGNIAKLAGFEGKLYRTYVVDEELIVGDTYTAYITGFTDVDENNNPVTRDGYIVFNDGLTENGSMFNTTRSFTFDVVKQGKFDHEIQFVGPKAGISGTLELDESITKTYDSIVNGVNTLTEVFADARKWISDSKIADLVKSLLDKLLDAGELIEWFNELTIPTLKTSDAISKTYEFTFPGLWCAETDAGFVFKNVDVAETGLKDSEFLLVNRDEAVDVLKLMVDIGKDAFNGAIKRTFGGEITRPDGEVVTYESIVNLYTELVKNEDGQLSLNYDAAYSIIEAYIGVIVDMQLFDRVIDTDSTIPKLKYPLPAILIATSNEEGLVEFTKNSNMTLTWMIDITRKIINAAGTNLEGKNEILDMLLKVVKYVDDLSANMIGDVINTLVYPFAQRLGLVGQKMGSGKYIMFQIKAADSYWINPLAYTMIVEWKNANWCYVTVADLGIIMPYFVEGFYDFVRNTTFAGTIDKFLNQITGKETNLITNILTDKIDITAEMGKVVTGALTAFVGQIGFNSLGLDTIFSTKSDFVAGLNKYLYENGRTAQNLMVYVNKQAMRAKSVYAGNLTPIENVDKDGNVSYDYWQFYSIDKSPTTTATKLIQKSTDNIAAAFVNPTKSGIVTNIGGTVKSIVGNVGYKIEETAKNIRAQIKSTIGSTIQGFVQSALDGVKNTVSTLFKGMLSRLFGSGMITYNA